MARPKKPRDPDSAKRLAEVITRLGRTFEGKPSPGAFVEGVDSPGRAKEAAIRDWINGKRGSMERGAFLSLLAALGVKNPEEVSQYVYEGGKKPSWWSDKSDTGFVSAPPNILASLPSAVAAASSGAPPQPATPLSSDPFMDVLKSLWDRKVRPEEARSTLETMVKIGIVRFGAASSSRGASSFSCKSTSGRLSSKPTRRKLGIVLQFPTLRRLTGNKAR